MLGSDAKVPDSVTKVVDDARSLVAATVAWTIGGCHLEMRFAVPGLTSLNVHVRADIEIHGAAPGRRRWQPAVRRTSSIYARSRLVLLTLPPFF
eukprot:13030985-Heterocapsa_arctica.AAC.1